MKRNDQSETVPAAEPSVIDQPTRDHPEGNCARDSDGRPVAIPLDQLREQIEKKGGD